MNASINLSRHMQEPRKRKSAYTSESDVGDCDYEIFG